MTEFALLLFVISFFLTLGSDLSPQVDLRMSYGTILLCCYFFSSFFSRGRKGCPSFKSPTAMFFLSLLGFEIARAVYSLLELSIAGSADRLHFLLLIQRLSSPLKWSLYAGCFAMSFSVFKTKNRIRRLLWLLSWCSFVLAMNAIPALLTKGYTGYIDKHGQVSFFYPFFYSHDLLSKYLIAHFAHINYSGDIIGLGFFSALGLFFYTLHLLREKKIGRPGRTEEVSATSPIIPGIFAGTIALAVVLILARGTIISFFFAFFLCILGMLLKFRSRAQAIFVGAAFLLICGFLLWAGNLEGVWKEVQTLKQETNATKQTSSSANREGARRAVAIFRDYPLWGVGNDGFAIVSERYAIPGAEQTGIIEFRAVCHYLQILAEEGVGSLLYFAFIIAYFVDITRGLLKTDSRFCFMACLGLFASVLMILIHASFNYLMERFSIAMPVYILMGASLAVLRPDFEH